MSKETALSSATVGATPLMPLPQDPPDGTQKALAVIKEQSAALTVPDAAEREIARMKKKSDQFFNGFRVCSFLCLGDFMIMAGMGINVHTTPAVTLGIAVGTHLSTWGAMIFCFYKSIAYDVAAWRVESAQLEAASEQVLKALPHAEQEQKQETRTDLLRKAGKTLLADIADNHPDVQPGQRIAFADPQNPEATLALGIVSVAEVWTVETPHDPDDRPGPCLRIAAKIFTHPPVESPASAIELTDIGELKYERPIRPPGKLVSPITTTPAPWRPTSAPRAAVPHDQESKP